MAQSTGLYYGEDGVAQVLGCTTSSHHVVGTSRIQLRENSRVEDLVVVGSAVGWWRPTAPSSGLGVLVVAANSRH